MDCGRSTSEGEEPTVKEEVSEAVVRPATAEASAPAVGTPRGTVRPRARGAGPPPLVIDSHFHLDQMERLLELKGLGPVSARRVGRPPKVPVSVVGGVLNYYDPEHYSGIVFPVDAQWKVVVGIHPKYAGRTCDRHIFELEQLLRDDRVVGVSELGLDYSVPDSLWTVQLGLMEWILRIGTIGKVHVLHIRGSRGDPQGEAVHEQCRKIMQKHCPPETRIHLHCCTGSATQVQRWMAAFPECHFGFTMMASRMSHPSQQALRELPAAPAGSCRRRIPPT
ncbi:putative deoxyribonuclease TATDN2 [Diadema antillarum]|uniref:putative deoxyribonuclease TATDN2 n=1 Tax=Diadema antillarum TaxID=105358 RepID=UPI003A89C312